VTTNERLSTDSPRIALTPLAPDAARGARTRERCRAAFERQAQHRAHRARMQSAMFDAFAQVIVAGCCLFYAAVLLVKTLGVEGLLD
jgi:hypothetical protein